MSGAWELRQEPHRSYWYTPEGGKPSWNGAGGKRIVSVTDVLDGGQNQLTGWAARQGVAAGEMVVRRYIGSDGALDAVDALPLSFGELAALQPEHPDTYRDHKAALGTRLHNYLADRLIGVRKGEMQYPLPYGLREAVDGFMTHYQPYAIIDEQGPRVERAVGHWLRAVAGTYDGQLFIPGLEPGAHRIDAKTSNMLQPKHWAQVAEYERLAVGCGEEASDWLTLLHFTPMGECKPYSIKVGGAENRLALSLFDAHLHIYRGQPKLAALLKD